MEGHDACKHGLDTFFSLFSSARRVWCAYLRGVCLCRFIPFSGGPRKCVGDQFALMEAVTALAVMLKRFDVEMVPDQDPGMTTGATIHTLNGLFVTLRERV